MEHIEIALRVLDAINGRRKPEACDLEELHRLAPGEANLPADELACTVILDARRKSMQERVKCAV